MKKTYIMPEAETIHIQYECFMETISLYKVGNVDDPTVGQGKSREQIIDDEEYMEYVLSQGDGWQGGLW